MKSQLHIIPLIIAFITTGCHRDDPKPSSVVAAEKTEEVHAAAGGAVKPASVTAAETTEEVPLQLPSEGVSVVCDSFINGEDAPPGNKVYLRVVGSLGTRQNPDNKAWELILKLEAKMASSVIQGAFTGNAIVVVKTFPLDVKQVAPEDGYTTPHIFSFTEDFADKRKEFSWSHGGFDRPKKILIGRIIYNEGENNPKRLTVFLNTQLPPVKVRLSR